MNRTIFVGLVTLTAACGGGGGARQLQYGTPQAPSTAEQLAGSDAQASLAANLSFAPTTEPTYGAPGLADQLVASLGGYAAPTARVGAPQVRRAVGRSVALAVGGTGLDPACVGITPTSVTWSACVVSFSETDPYSGDTTDMTVRIDGRLGWNPGTGTTTWTIDERIAMTVVSGGDTMRMNGTVGLGGTVTVTASTIVGHTGSDVDVAVNYMGMNLGEAVATSLDLDLGYQADPFCVTGGTLTLQQLWTKRPAGATAADLPDQGWKFAWSGCGLFTVAHGN